MDVGKIFRLVVILVAVVAAFVALPEEAAIIALLGLIGGYFVDGEQASRFLIVTLALALVSSAGALQPIWGVGQYLSDILGSVSALFNAAAVTVIVMGTYRRLKP